MKIIHIINSLDVGGAEQMLKRLLVSDLAAHSNTMVISLINIGQIGKELRNLGFSVYSLNTHRIWHIPFTLFKLIKLLYKNNPDIVQTWLYHSDFLGGIAAKLVGVKSIIWGIRSTELRKKAYHTKLIRRLCAVLSYVIPSRIICVAHASKQKHISLGYCAKKMSVIHNGFDFSVLHSAYSERQNLRLKHGINDSHLVIGCLGRFSPVKGHDMFVSAMKSLAQDFPNARFLMIGRDLDFFNAQLVKWINATGVAERFILLGERNDVAVCLSAMDIFCLPSRSEGFPNALAEAMAMGLPCVATNVGDAAILLGKTGVLVNKENLVALTTELIAMLRLPPEARKEMGNRSSERVRSLFSIHKALLEFNAVYMECIKCL